MKKKSKKNTKGKKSKKINPIYSNTPFINFRGNLAVVTGSDVQVTNDGNGKYIVLEMTIIGGPQSEHRHFVKFMVEHKNRLAADIGRRLLKDFLIAANFSDGASVTDTDEFHGLLVVIDIEINGLSRGLITTFKKPSKFIRKTIHTFTKLPWEKGTQK